MGKSLFFVFPHAYQEILRASIRLAGWSSGEGVGLWIDYAGSIPAGSKIFFLDFFLNFFFVLTIKNVFLLFYS